ncbi:unnamed protein product [Thelazia callipaeda]|uniref:FYVE, RhoGEF and PH domain-containing protein 5 n=1 Tax=Thelazia callipaeda TaxID=103827 RepID=A0A0N5CY73_THECL|nr:unnamed protein product [Thelazia callipaeda]
MQPSASVVQAAFKRSKRIKCGRIILFVDQLYGWRGIDTGFYGSEMSEDTYDYHDKIGAFETQNEDENSQMQTISSCEEQPAKEKQEVHANFNICTGRAPTPNFSFTYIETSYNSSRRADHSVQPSDNNTTLINDGSERCSEKTCLVDPSDENTSERCSEKTCLVDPSDENTSGRCSEKTCVVDPSDENTSVISDIVRASQDVFSEGSRTLANSSMQSKTCQDASLDENITTAAGSNEYSCTEIYEKFENSSGEPMEIDGSSYFRCTLQDHMDKTIPVYSENFNMIPLWNIEMNENEPGDLLTAAKSISSEEQMLTLKADDKAFVTEKLLDDKNVAVVKIKNDEEKCSFPVVVCECTNKMLDDAEDNAEIQDICSDDILKEELQTQDINKEVFECPDSLQTSDLSHVDCVDSLTSAKALVSQVSESPRISRIPRFNLLKMNMSNACLTPPHYTNLATVSFKTPLRNAKVFEGRDYISKQDSFATPLFKKKSIHFAKTHRNNTPVKESECCVCPRYLAHHKKFSDHATQTIFELPVSRRISFKNEVTPPCSRFTSRACRNSTVCTTQNHTPSKIPVLCSALIEISNYETPSPSPKRIRLVDYSCTPLSCRKQFTCQDVSKVSTPRHIESKSSSGYLVPQVPITRFAFEHLKSGGTPRPKPIEKNKRLNQILSEDTVMTEPKTPVMKINISEMLVEKIGSGPINKRRYRSQKSPSIEKIHLEGSISSDENLRLSTESVNLAVSEVQDFPCNEKGFTYSHLQVNIVLSVDRKSILEEMDRTRVVVIDSSDNSEMEELVKSTSNLKIEPAFPQIVETIFDSTCASYQKQLKMPIFDLTNSNKDRRILTVLNDSNISTNTPGKEGGLNEFKIDVDNFSCSDVSNDSSDIVHIVAAKNENRQCAILHPRKILRPEITEAGCRRSMRNRTAPIRQWLGEKLLYKRDKEGTYEMNGVQEAVIKDPLYVKYMTINMNNILEQKKRKQGQFTRARKLRELASSLHQSSKENFKKSKKT